MKKIKILDCTLRDGGYINNWKFNNYMGEKILEALIESNIDIQECGYLNNSIPYDEHSTIFESFHSIEKYFQKNKRNSNLVTMINHNTIDIDKLPDYSTTSINGIRYAFHKKDMKDAFHEMIKIKEKGFNLFVQPMVSNSYEIDEFIELIKKTNTLSPYSFYIVDSFGSMDQKVFMKYLDISLDYLDTNIYLGFHGHNNMQYAYADAINLTERSKDRDIIIDSSIYGMGRGAGNLNTEIITHYLNQYYNKNYLTTPLLEIMDNYLEKIYKENPWGFSAGQYLSAKHNCHPNYANFLTSMKKLPIKEIDTILASLPINEKKEFDENFIQESYFKHNNSNSEEIITLDISKSKKILILGSGTTLNKEYQKIQTFIKKYKPFIVTLNFKSNKFKSDFIFFSNQKRFDEYHKETQEDRVIITSNIKYPIENKNIQKISYSKLLDSTIDNIDNVLSLCLSMFNIFDITNIFLAGIDGYNISKQNYATENIILNDTDFMEKENSNIQKVLNFFFEKLRIRILTTSLFKVSNRLRILGVIPARYNSSRLQGKPLCSINGIPMIKRTYEQAKKSNLLDDLIVATDDNRIESYCIKENIPVIMTSERCLTGTDRIAEVSTKLDYDLYINIQGDEPIIDPKSIDEIVSDYKIHTDEYIAYNLYKYINEKDEITTDTIIKVITNEKDELMYMSRLSVPFNKSNDEAKYKKQVCVYGFTKKALDIFSKRTKTLNEQYEDIEILRFIDMGYKVKMKETNVVSISVDVPSDILKVEKVLNEKGLK